MKSRIELALLKVSDPRVVKIAIIAATLLAAALPFLMPADVVYACPAGAGGGCTGG